MTLNELKNEVAQLGFESQIEDTECFISSANRALNLIYTDRPVSKSTYIFIDSPEVVSKYDRIEHKPGEDVTIFVKGYCLSFISSGNGECVISDPFGSSTVILNTKNQITKRTLNGEATLTFKGNFYFTVNHLATFKYYIGTNQLSIPEYTPIRELNIGEYCADFRALAAEPCDKNGQPVKSLVMRDGMIYVPFEFKDEIYLTYYRAPTLITTSSPNQLIDISEECKCLLPLLTASFMWLDDDAAKAQYYMSLYRDSVANIRRYSSKEVDTAYRVNGWA